VFEGNVAAGSTALGGALLVRRIAEVASSLQRERRLLSLSDNATVELEGGGSVRVVKQWIGAWAWLLRARQDVGQTFMADDAARNGLSQFHVQDKQRSDGREWFLYHCGAVQEGGQCLCRRRRRHRPRCQKSEMPNLYDLSLRWGTMLRYAPCT
jgi:hypothetical protein